MSGRHTTSGSAPRSRRSWLLIALVTVLVLPIGLLVLATYPHHRSPAAASSSGTTGSGPCSSGVALSVVAAPDVAAVITDVAAHWSATRPIIDGACPAVVVHPVTAAAEERALAQPNVALPDLWIPDSSLWIRRLQTAAAGQDSGVQSMWLYPAIASSPLVLAGTAAAARALHGPAAGGWAKALAGSDAVSMIDPTTTTEGLLALLTAQRLLPGGAGTPSAAFVRALVGLSHSILPNTDAGFLALRQAASTSVAFPASEQEVQSAGDASGVTAETVTPKGAGFSLDFPVAQFAPPGGSPAQRDAATQFAAQLSAGYAQTQLRAAHLRNAAGTPLAATRIGGGPDPGSVPGGATTAAPAVTNVPAGPTPDQVTDALRVWSAAGRTSRTLVVIDTSGSMANSIGGGRSKIQFAAAAAHTAVNFFPNSSSLGLWDFSQGEPTDWTQLVSLGALGSRYGRTTRRQALIAAADALPNMVQGNTGLYQTVLAAFNTVRTGYDPAAANSIVLLTDGANTDTAGIELAGLLSTLRSGITPGHPLPVITIGVGADADLATLRRISAATGGATLTAAEPAQIRGAVIDAIVKAG